MADPRSYSMPSPFNYSRQFSDIITPDEAAGVQYRFELSRLLDEYNKENINKAQLHSLVESLADTAGVTSPAVKAQILGHQALNQAPQRPKIKPVTAQDEKEGIDYALQVGKELWQTISNFGDIADVRYGAAQQAAGTISDYNDQFVADKLRDPNADANSPEFFEDLISYITPSGSAEAGAQRKAEAQASLAASGYTPPETPWGQAFENVTTLPGELLLGLFTGAVGAGAGGTLGLASPVPFGSQAGFVWGGILGSQAGMQTYAALQAAGETMDSWKNHPMWQEMKGKYTSQELPDIERDLTTKIARRAYNNRMTSLAAVTDALSGIPVAKGAAIGTKIVANIGFDAATEAASEFSDVVVQGYSVNQILKEHAQEQGFDAIANSDELATDYLSWLDKTENRNQAFHGAYVGAIAGGMTSGVISTAEVALDPQTKLQQKKEAEDRLEAEAEAGAKAVDKAIKDERLAREQEKRQREAEAAKILQDVEAQKRRAEQTYDLADLTKEITKQFSPATWDGKTYNPPALPTFIRDNEKTYIYAGLSKRGVRLVDEVTKKVRVVKWADISKMEKAPAEVPVPVATDAQPPTSTTPTIVTERDVDLEAPLTEGVQVAPEAQAATTQQDSRLDDLQARPLKWGALQLDSENKKYVKIGEDRIVRIGGRPMIVVPVNGVPVLFYNSTGAGGKENVAKHKWYPVWGLGKNEDPMIDGWLNKTTEEDINNYYGSPELKEMAERLDQLFPVTDPLIKNAPRVRYTSERKGEQRLEKALKKILGYEGVSYDDANALDAIRNRAAEQIARIQKGPTETQKLAAKRKAKQDAKEQGATVKTTPSPTPPPTPPPTPSPAPKKETTTATSEITPPKEGTILTNSKGKTPQQWKFVEVEQAEGKNKGKWKVQGLHKEEGKFNWFTADAFDGKPAKTETQKLQERKTAKKEEKAEKATPTPTPIPTPPATEETTTSGVEGTVFEYTTQNGITSKYKIIKVRKGGKKPVQVQKEGEKTYRYFTLEGIRSGIQRTEDKKAKATQKPVEAEKKTVDGVAEDLVKQVDTKKEKGTEVKESKPKETEVLEDNLQYEPGTKIRYASPRVKNAVPFELEVTGKNDKGMYLMKKEGEDPKPYKPATLEAGIQKAESIDKGETPAQPKATELPPAIKVGAVVPYEKADKKIVNYTIKEINGNDVKATNENGKELTFKNGKIVSPVERALEKLLAAQTEAPATPTPAPPAAEKPKAAPAPPKRNVAPIDSRNLTRELAQQVLKKGQPIMHKGKLFYFIDATDKQVNWRMDGADKDSKIQWSTLNTYQKLEQKKANIPTTPDPREATPSSTIPTASPAPLAATTTAASPATTGPRERTGTMWRSEDPGITPEADEAIRTRWRGDDAPTDEDINIWTGEYDEQGRPIGEGEYRGLREDDEMYRLAKALEEADTPRQAQTYARRLVTRRNQLAAQQNREAQAAQVGGTTAGVTGGLLPLGVRIDRSEKSAYAKITNEEIAGIMATVLGQEFSAADVAALTARESYDPITVSKRDSELAARRREEAYEDSPDLSADAIRRKREAETGYSEVRASHLKVGGIAVNRKTGERKTVKAMTAMLDDNGILQPIVLFDDNDFTANEFGEWVDSEFDFVAPVEEATPTRRETFQQKELRILELINRVNDPATKEELAQPLIEQRRQIDRAIRDLQRDFTPEELAESEVYSILLRQQEELIQQAMSTSVPDTETVIPASDVPIVSVDEELARLQEQYENSLTEQAKAEDQVDTTETTVEVGDTVKYKGEDWVVENISTNAKGVAKAKLNSTTGGKPRTVNLTTLEEAKKEADGDQGSVLMSEESTTEKAKLDRTDKPHQYDVLRHLVDWLTKSVFKGLNADDFVVFKDRAEAVAAYRGKNDAVADKLESGTMEGSKIEGAVVPGADGPKVIFIADQFKLSDLKPLIRRGLGVFYHEAIGHYGLRKTFGSQKSYDDFAKRVYTDRRKEIDAWYNNRYRQPSGTTAVPNSQNHHQDAAIRAHEWLAQNFTEDGIQELNLIDRVHLYLRDKLQGRDKQKITDAFVIRMYSDINKELRATKKKQKAASTVTKTAPKVAKPAKTTESEEKNPQETKKAEDNLTDKQKAIDESASIQLFSEHIMDYADAGEPRVAVDTGDARTPATLRKLFSLEPYKSYGFRLEELADGRMGFEIPDRFAVDYVAPFREVVTPESGLSEAYTVMSENYAPSTTNAKGVTGKHFDTYEDVVDFYNRTENLGGTQEYYTTDTPLERKDHELALRDINHRLATTGVTLAELSQLYEAEQVQLSAALNKYNADNNTDAARIVQKQLINNYLTQEFLANNELVPATPTELVTRGRVEEFVPFSEIKDEHDSLMQELGDSTAVAQAMLRSGVRGTVSEEGYTVFDDYDPEVQQQVLLSERAGEFGPTHMSQENGLRKLGAKIHQFFDPFAGLSPEMAQFYRQVKNRFAGVVGEIEETYGTLASSFENLDTEEIQQVFDAFTATNATERQEIIDGLAPDVQANVIKAREKISQTGLSLVRAGLLSPESFDKYDGNYLPRKYLMYLLNEDDRIAFSSGKAVSNLDYLSRRKDIDQALRSFWGEVKDPMFLTARALIQPNRDLAMLEMFQLLAQVSRTPETRIDSMRNQELPLSGIRLDDDIQFDFVHRDSFITVNYAEFIQQALDDANLNAQDVLGGPVLQQDDKQVSASFLRSEAERIRNLADNSSGDKADLYRRVARSMEDRANENLDFDYDPSLWVPVPDDVRYGAFRGMLLRKEIYQDILGDVELYKKMNDEWAVRQDKFIDFWKWGKVVANIPSWGRNIVSNLIMMHLAGMPLHRLDYLWKAASEIRNKGDRYNEFKREGLVKTTFSANELRQLDRKSLARIARAEREARGDEPKDILELMKSLAEPGSQLDRKYTWLREVTGDLYQGIEVWNKLAFAMYMQDQKGMSAADALIEANKPLFDYSEVSQGIRWVRRSAFGMPFVTWTYKATPFFADIIKSPSKWHRLAVPLALNYGLAQYITRGLEDEDEEQFKALMPDWVQKKGPFMFPFPYKDENGNVLMVDMQYLLPYASHAQAIEQLLSLEFSNAAKTMGAFSSPFWSMTVAAASGYDPFKQREIVDDPDISETDKWLAYAKFYYDSVMPAMLASNGTAMNLLDAGLHELGYKESLVGDSLMYDSRGNIRNNIWQALSKTAGFNAYGFKLSEEQSKRMNTLNFRLRKAKQAMNREVERYSKIGNLDDEKLARIKEDYERKAKDIYEEMARLTGGSLSRIEENFE